MQKSLVALQNQIASIRRKDVKSKNRKQTKSPKGPTRKNSMKGYKDSTSNKKSMAKRARGKADEEDFEPLTVEQKNELGERINRLSEEKTNELIALISASGAHLEVCIHVDFNEYNLMRDSRFRINIMLDADNIVLL